MQLEMRLTKKWINFSMQAALSLLVVQCFTEKKSVVALVVIPVPTSQATSVNLSHATPVGRHE